MIFKTRFLKFVVIGLCITGIFSGCASDEKPDPKVKSGAYLTQLFPVDKPTPQRPKNDDVFYYKHCEQSFWRKADEYTCTEPRR